DGAGGGERGHGAAHPRGRARAVRGAALRPGLAGGGGRAGRGHRPNGPAPLRREGAVVRGGRRMGIAADPERARRGTRRRRRRGGARPGRRLRAVGRPRRAPARRGAADGRRPRGHRPRPPLPPRLGGAVLRTLAGGCPVGSGPTADPVGRGHRPVRVEAAAARPGIGTRPDRGRRAGPRAPDRRGGL
ncbi:MAG: Transcriptional regulator, AcrR family, partial [uncultured Thermomicrobiales bacterium]